MAQADKTWARKAAQELSADLNVFTPPVGVQRIAEERLLIPVVFRPLERDVSGALAVIGGLATIVVNQAETRERRRFTIAHEIGHWVLHVRSNLTSTPTDASQYVDGYDNVDFRDDESSSGKNSDEIEANAFANELLMPEAIVRADFRNAMAAHGANIHSFRDHRTLVVQPLAGRYVVSVSAMSCRLRNLNLITPMVYHALIEPKGTKEQ